MIVVTCDLVNARTKIRHADFPSSHKIHASVQTNARGNRATSAMETLCGLVDDPLPAVRLASIDALAGMGAAAKEAAPVLAKALEDPSSHIPSV